MSHCFFFFFNFLASLRYLSFFSFSFSFILCSAGTAKSTILEVLFLLLLLLLFSSGRLMVLCISKCQRSMSVSFSRRDAEGAYIICSVVHTRIPYTIPSRLPCPPHQPCLVLNSSFVICCIRLSCD